MEAPSPKRTSGVRLGRRLALAAAAAALAFTAGCEGSPGAIADRVLARYQKRTGSKPLTAGGMIRIRLSPAPGQGSASGSSEILWEPLRYRESVSSAGWTELRGIELGRAYFTDQDGVTRVLSEAALRELTTRSYFWRRAWLFRDREGARAGLGPASDEEASVRLQPSGGNPLLLTFSRRDGGLRAARSPRFDLVFSSETMFQDRSDPRRPVLGEIGWSGLPTGEIPRPVVGGGRARFSEAVSRVPLDPAANRVVIPARLGGEPVRLALDAMADGPVRISRALRERLRLAPTTDVFGRRVASGVSLAVSGLEFPSLFVEEAADALPEGTDAVAGGCLFREAILEFDPDARLLGLHDPERWTIPDGYFRVVIDDDGDRPVAILDRGSKSLRVAAGSDTGAAALELAAESARRLGLERETAADGMLWGAFKLPPLPFRVADAREYSPDWGDDGRLGFALLLRFHAFVNMPQRWIYFRPAGAGAKP